MSRCIVRWAVPALILLVPLGIVGLPALAEKGDIPPPGDVSRAKEMAALIEQGQLNLRDATELAEKHIKGTALEARCAVLAAEPTPDPTVPPRSGDPTAEKAPRDGKRLIYDVSCFAKDNLQMVRVDGLARKVITGPAPK